VAIARNGLRIFALGELCVHFGPKQIDSPLHSKGGAIFFVLSLFSLLILVAPLKKVENRRQGHWETAKAPEENTGFSGAQE
jgi:hypothetical protein